MIHHIKGTLVMTAPNFVVIDVSGIGFGIKTTLTTISQLPPINSPEAKQVSLYTYLHVREDALELFGFSSAEELSCYQLLTSISGVGPKAALAVLSDNTPEQFASCIAAHDVKRLTKSAGIGKKTAERMVLELQDKITGFATGSSVISGGNAPSGGGLFSDNVAGAIEALEALGFSPSDGARVVTALDNTLSVEELIKLALGQLSAR